MSQHAPQIAALERRAERDRRALERGSAVSADASTVPAAAERPANSPTASADAEDGLEYLRHGVGPAVWLYVEGRTGGRLRRFSPAELDALERAMNLWLECYAACQGVDLEANFTVREAAELLLETRNVYDVGSLLTGVARGE